MKTFVPGAIASASEVNANFQELQTDINALKATGWQNATMSSDWSHGGTLKIKKHGTLFEIRGQIGKGANGNDFVQKGTYSSVATLPSGYRPSESVQLHLGGWELTDPQEVPAGMAVITNAGVVNIYVTTAAYSFRLNGVFGS